MGEFMKKIYYILILSFLILITSIYVLLNINYINEYNIEELREKDSIHFINTGNSDCILISSNGEFGLIDCGLGKSFVENKEVIATNVLVPYLYKLNDNKEIKIKFAIGTHTHKDHISGFIDILDYDDISIDEFYIKKRNKTGNKKLYNQLLDKMKEKKVFVNHDVENLELVLGNFKLKIYNGNLSEPTKYGDNDNSLAILVTNKDKKALLAGDINNYSSDEELIAKKVGKINLLKVPHHGYKGSSTTNFLKELKPEYSITTNFKFKDPFVWFRLKIYTKTKPLVTGKENGIVAIFDEKITLYKNINK